MMLANCSRIIAQEAHRRSGRKLHSERLSSILGQIGNHGQLILPGPRRLWRR
jgi:hypothetical protein